MHEPIMNVCLELKEPVQGWGKLKDHYMNFLMLKLWMSWKESGKILSSCYWFSVMKKQIGSLKFFLNGNFMKFRIWKRIMRQVKNIRFILPERIIENEN